MRGGGRGGTAGEQKELTWSRWPSVVRSERSSGPSDRPFRSKAFLTAATRQLYMVVEEEEASVERGGEEEGRGRGSDARRERGRREERRAERRIVRL